VKVVVKLRTTTGEEKKCYGENEFHWRISMERIIKKRMSVA
jgi:hypothetical protein